MTVEPPKRKKLGTAAAVCATSEARRSWSTAQMRF